jgi:hypothetical protein
MIEFLSYFILNTPHINYCDTPLLDLFCFSTVWNVGHRLYVALHNQLHDCLLCLSSISNGETHVVNLSFLIRLQLERFQISSLILFDPRQEIANYSWLSKIIYGSVPRHMFRHTIFFYSTLICLKSVAHVSSWLIVKSLELVWNLVIVKCSTGLQSWVTLEILSRQ